MMVVKAEVILALQVLRPLQDLMKFGLVKRRAHKSVVTFVSHQWLARNHPDPEGLQLRVLQRFLEAGACKQMGRGKIFPET